MLRYSSNIVFIRSETKGFVSAYAKKSMLSHDAAHFVYKVVIKVVKIDMSIIYTCENFKCLPVTRKRSLTDIMLMNSKGTGDL